MTTLEFIFQILGFFLQTYPIAVLSFVPFSEKELFGSTHPHTRGKLYCFLSAALFLAALCFAAVCNLIFSSPANHTQLLRTVSNLYMCGFLIFYTTFFFLRIHTKMLKKLLVFILLIHYEAILFTIASSVSGLLKAPSADDILIVYDFGDILTHFFLLLFTFPVVYLFLKRVVQPCLPAMEGQILRRGCFYLLGTLSLFSACIFVLTNFYFHYGITKYPILFLLFALILTNTIVYYIFFTEVHLFTANQELEKQLRSFDEDYRKISISIEEARRARHDLRHHLDIIDTLHREKREEELTEYLNQYKSFSQELNEMFLSGYPSLDILLSFYIQRTKEEGIAVDADIQPFRKNLKFDIIDLTVLIGNMMENAINACHTLNFPNAQPYIHIWIRIKENVLLLKMKNSCSPSLKKTPDYTDGTEFISTNHTGLHGHGLKSIRCIAEKYGGSAEFKQENGVFSVRVVLNIP